MAPVEVALKKRVSYMLETDNPIWRLITSALANKIRRHILAILFEHEAKTEEPLSYVELLDKVRRVAKNLSSSRFAYHLKILQEAGLIYRLTRLSEEPTPETAYRSFYKTTPLALRILSTLMGIEG